MKVANRFLMAIICFLAVSLTAKAQTGSRNLNIVFMGNSITYGGGLTDPAHDAPPVKAAEWLRGQAGVGKVEIRNMGFSGHTTLDFLPGKGRDFKLVERAAKGFSDSTAQLVFSLILGTNDSAVKGPNGSPVSPQDYEANLHAIADQLLREFPNCKLIFHQPTWYSPNTHNRSLYGAEGLKRLQSYFPFIRKVVKSYRKSQPNRVFLGDTKAFKFFKYHAPNYLQPEDGADGVFYLHPNKTGAIILGEYWAKAIYKDLL